MSARAFDIMDELPAIFATVSGIEAAKVEIGYREPSTLAKDELPRVLVYNPSTDEPEKPVFGLRAIEYGFTLIIVNDLNTDEATMQLCEEMAAALGAASLTNADTVFMNPGSITLSPKTRRSIVGAFIAAEWEGL